MRIYKNVRIKKSPLIKDRLLLINKIIKECVNESFESSIPTKYVSIEDGYIRIYRFKTNSGNSYDLEFIFGVQSTNIKLDNNKILGDYFEDVENGLILTVDVAFVPSEVNMVDRENPNLYTKETNRHEQFELIGRISYLLKDFYKKNPKIKVYILGKDTKKTKLDIYLKLFKNLFSGDFQILEGENKDYDNGSYYFIKN